MERCDVLVVGGGPAGSACARMLRRAGLDVIVMDRALFPRDKVCGGWITPQVVTELELDLDDYRKGRTLQAITGFRTGTIGGPSEIETAYGRVVSFGIRRCEFDDYLLQRCGARLRCGAAVSGIRRSGSRWVVNDAVTAAVLVGAGGHFCPVARLINGELRDSVNAPLVVAQEVEFRVDPSAAAAFRIAPDVPELFFCRDLKGYGWCFRKGAFLNIGLGRADSHSLPAATAEFVAYLECRQKIPRDLAWKWRGHAYLLHGGHRRRVVDDRVLLIGDAAGIAYPQSGEGIRPAVESGLLAAATILEAAPRFTQADLAPYERRLRARLGHGLSAGGVPRLLPARFWAPLAGLLLRTPGFVRRVALDRWFLNADLPPLAVA